MPKTEERERSTRLIVVLTAALRHGTEHYVVDTENVSVDGLCLSPQKLFPVGTELHMAFGHPPELPQISADGIVRWNDAEKRVGVQFTTINPAHQEALRKFVHSESGIT